MRSVLGLSVGCGILMLVACSRTEPPGAGGPGAGGPVVATTSAVAAAESVMEGNTGLAVGQKAPSFVLEDQAGTERSLDDFLKEGKVALVFYRSADW